MPHIIFNVSLTKGLMPHKNFILKVRMDLYMRHMCTDISVFTLNHITHTILITARNYL